MFAASPSPHAVRAQRHVLIARWVGIISAALGGSVGSRADGSGPNAYRHATTYCCATINTATISTGAIRASVMNANAADANASPPTAIRECIS